MKLLKVLAAADRFTLPGLVAKCEGRLATMASAATLPALTDLAVRFGLGTLATACRAVACRSLGHADPLPDPLSWAAALGSGSDGADGEGTGLDACALAEVMAGLEAYRLTAHHLHAGETRGHALYLSTEAREDRMGCEFAILAPSEEAEAAHDAADY